MFKRLSSFVHGLRRDLSISYNLKIRHHQRIYASCQKCNLIPPCVRNVVLLRCIGPNSNPRIAISRAAQKLLLTRCMSHFLPVQNNYARSSWLLWCTKALYKYPTAVLQKALPLHPTLLIFILFKTLIPQVHGFSARSRSLYISDSRPLKSSVYQHYGLLCLCPNHGSRQAMRFGTLGSPIYV